VTDDQWRHARPVLTKAIALDPSERDRLLQSAFASDLHLRSQLLEVLNQYGNASRRFLGAGSADEPAALPDIAPDDYFLEAGDMCNRYRVVRPLGLGGMGQVYLAEEVDLGTPVALKLVSSPMLGSAEARSRLQREASRAAQLRFHPHIATVLQLMELEVRGRPVTVLAMEYVSGRSANQILGDGPLSCERAVGWAVQVARAMEFAHERGVVHCDLKPANLQIEERENGDHVKVLDFGIARAIVESPSPEGVAGTLAYMAPEQLSAGECTPASDIYALGVTLYELVTGRRPYGAADREKLLLEIIGGPVPRAAAVVPALPRALDEVLQRAMAKDVAHRFQTMREFRKGLEELRLNGAKRAGWSVYASAAAVAFVVVTILGFAASQALDAGLGRAQPVTLSSIFDWFVWGARSLVAPLGTAIIFALIFLCATAVLRLLTWMPPFAGLVHRLGGPYRKFATAAAAMPTSVLAQALLVLQFVVLAGLVAYFFPLLQGFANFMTGQGAIDVLRPSNWWLHYRYGFLVTAQLLIFCIAWYKVIRLRATRRERDGIAFVVAGVAAIGISTFLFTARFRILAQNDSERVVYSGQTCYLVEERPTTALLYCPLVSPRSVIAKAENVERTGNIENIFSVFERGNSPAR
jgi:hypothetical protein